MRMRRFIHPAREDISLPNVMYAFSDPMRLKIVAQLAAAPNYELRAAECYGDDDTAKSTVSHHFRALREAGITRTTPHGRELLISLRKDDLEALFPGLLEAVCNAYNATMAEEASEKKG